MIWEKFFQWNDFIFGNNYFCVPVGLVNLPYQFPARAARRDYSSISPDCNDFLDPRFAFCYHRSNRRSFGAETAAFLRVKTYANVDISFLCDQCRADICNKFPAAFFLGLTTDLALDINFLSDICINFHLAM